jgi:cyclic 2,3-diphosphoglycerate synthetase
VGRTDVTVDPGGLPLAVALIDGEHYPPVVRAALDRLGTRYRFAAALFLGGREKLRAADERAVDRLLAAEYGLPVRRAAVPRELVEAPQSALPRALLALLDETHADAVVDLSDEPVVGYRERFLLMSAAAARGVRYVGADFELTPQALGRLDSAPSVAVIGTGKRVGKTAVSGRLARDLTARQAGRAGVVIVAMGRGGPPRPEIVRGEQGIGAAELLAASRQGRHAASDHYEDAALAGVTTVGCRRCGGGLAGAAFDSTVGEALALVERMGASLVILEGSGSVVPPVRTDATVCVAAANQPLEYIGGYLGTYRLLVSDLLLLTLCETPFADAEKVRRVAAEVGLVRPDLAVVPTVFRPRPLADIGGRRVAYFTTAAAEGVSALARHLEEAYGAQVVLACGGLADRPALAAAVERAASEADVFVTEIKAAAIDVVAEAAAAAGKELVFCDNEPVAMDGSDLSAALADVAGLAERRFAVRGGKDG